MAELLNPWAGKLDPVTGKRTPLFLNLDDDSFNLDEDITIPPTTEKPPPPKEQPEVTEQAVSSTPRYNAYGRWAARVSMAQGASGGPARTIGYLSKESDVQGVNRLRDSERGWSGDRGVPVDPSTGRPMPFGVMGGFAPGQTPKMVINNTIMTPEEAAKRFEKAPETAAGWEPVPVPNTETTAPPLPTKPPAYFDTNAEEQVKIAAAEKHATEVSGLPIQRLQNQDVQEKE